MPLYVYMVNENKITISDFCCALFYKMRPCYCRLFIFQIKWEESENFVQCWSFACYLTIKAENFVFSLLLNQTKDYHKIMKLIKLQLIYSC